MWEATGGHQNQSSPKKNNVVQRAGQNAPLLVAGAAEGWTQHSQRETAAANQVGADFSLQAPPTHFPEFLPAPLQKARQPRVLWDLAIEPAQHGQAQRSGLQAGESALPVHGGRPSHAHASLQMTSGLHEHLSWNVCALNSTPGGREGDHRELGALE